MSFPLTFSFFFFTILIVSINGDDHRDGRAIGILNITCLNGGSVIEGKCHCRPRFEGQQCEREPCLNGGRKLGSSSGGKCHCPFGVTGRQCESIIECTPGNGELIDGKCVCKKQWAGIFCQQRTCHNGQFDSVDGICICDIGFQGPFCELPIVCVHGEISSANECLCEANWSGSECGICSLPFELIGRECVLLHGAGESMEVVSSNRVTRALPYVMVGAVALVLLAVIVTTIALVSKRFGQKPSRVSSTEVADTAHV